MESAWYIKEEQDIRVNKMEALTYGMHTVHVEKISYTFVYENDKP